MMKRSVLSTLKGQDPFEELSREHFKEGTINELEMVIKYDYTVKVTLLNVVYQIITFMLCSLEGEDLQQYAVTS